MKYDNPKEGEQILINMHTRNRYPYNANYKMACCDCGLVHLLKYSIHKPTGWLSVRAWRDNRATGQMRRWKK